MGKIKAHGIAFEEAETFDVGSRIKGYVFVELTQSLKLRGIKLLFRGLAKVQWTETKSEYDALHQRTKTRTVTIQSRRNYLNHFILLHGVRPKDGNVTIEMPPGSHKFPFVFTLPRNLPASFEGAFGHVRYYAESNIDLPWKFDPISKRSFQVRAVADLNLNPINRCGLSGEKEKTLCCLCCQSGPITATFKVLQQGFVPGEAIKLFAEISNDSDRKVSKSYVNLNRRTTFYAEGKQRSKVVELARITRPAINPHGKDVWRGQSLVVPQTPPTGFPGCDIMDVAYTLRLNVDPSGLSLDLEIPFKINIGTIPVRQQQRIQAQGNVEESLVNFANGSSMVPSYCATAPPSYDGHATAPPFENEEAPPSYQFATAPLEEDEQIDDKPIMKGGYQRLS